MTCNIAYDVHEQMWIAKTLAGTPICQASSCVECSHMAYERGYYIADIDTSTDPSFVAAILEFGSM